MKITFQFDNGTSRVILEPTSARDERYLELVRDGKPQVTIDASNAKSLVLKFSEPEAKNLPPFLETIRHG